ncbi:hypothetical protein PGT21_012033 [Puccinia graminis f. sp. tritici]|uniref:Uncharacterized protein n=1 Tax=Puccinia graminis f. sp. tritici TaxID=56615 RepID=A0A5B0RGC8_PUCGR|nr:hypothetical protein PGT21_012033 [Puccinia graminis f. sp. tritici]KAA1124810.1 hypothetical protein PGTUg99_035297 [Puccinia graminis f. sp. tritici]
MFGYSGIYHQGLLALCFLKATQGVQEFPSKGKEVLPEIKTSENGVNMGHFTSWCPSSSMEVENQKHPLCHEPIPMTREGNTPHKILLEIETLKITEVSKESKKGLSLIQEMDDELWSLKDKIERIERNLYGNQRQQNIGKHTFNWDFEATLGSYIRYDIRRDFRNVTSQLSR